MKRQTLGRTLRMTFRGGAVRRHLGWHVSLNKKGLTKRNLHLVDWT
jgi:hypothetical protein